MDWKGLGKEIIKKGAPVLGGVVGGPGGATIGNLVASLFGTDPDDPEALSAAISADPEAALKLKQLELEHKIEFEKLYISDIHSARDREISVSKATGKTNWPLYILAAVIVSGFFGLIFLLLKFQVPEGSREVAFMLFGALSTSFGSVVSYFFGSSKGSSDKNAIIAAKK